MTKAPKNIGVSVLAQLLKLSKLRNEDNQLLLTRYANERLLYRLSTSRHKDQFVLKGAALFTVWSGHAHRATRDVDLLGFGTPTIERLRTVFEDVLARKVPDDGVAFDLTTLKVETIRENQTYGGLRVAVVAVIASARVPLQVDVGFGDAITPGAETIEFPPLLDFPAPTLHAYPRETVVAEKLDAMVRLGIANTRMKDFFDIALLARDFDFDGATLIRAIRATFERRQTPIPVGLPISLTSTFAEDTDKKKLWKAFMRRSSANDFETLAVAVDAVVAFVQEPLGAAREGREWRSVWKKGGPWT